MKIVLYVKYEVNREILSRVIIRIKQTEAVNNYIVHIVLGEHSPSVASEKKELPRQAKMFC